MGQGADSAKIGEADTRTRQFLLLLWRLFTVSHPPPVGLGCVYAFFLYPRTRQGIAKHCAFKQRGNHGVAVQEHASVDLHPSSGNRIFPYGHRILFESLPEPQAVYLAERSFPVAHGVPDGRNRDYSPMGLEILLVFCAMDGLRWNMDDWGSIPQVCDA